MTSRFALSTVLKTVLAVLSVVTFASASLAQDVPHKVSYQGLLTDGAGQPIADGDHVATFTLYTDAAGTTTYWTSTFHITSSQGIFNVVLGDSGAPLPTPLTLPMWLGVKVENGTELRPLTQVVSAPYALGIVDSAVSTSKIQDGAVTRDKMGQDFVGHVTLNRGQFTTQKGKDVDFTVGTNLNLRVDTTNGQVHAIIDALGGGTLNEVRVDPQGGLIITAGGGNANFVTLAIGAQGVQTYMIRDKAVDSTKLADGSVNSRTIQDGSVTGTDIASNTVTGNNIKDGTIQGVDIAIPLILTRSTPGDVLDVTNTSDNTGGVSVVNFQGNSSDGTSVVAVNGNVDGGNLVALTQNSASGTGLSVQSAGNGIYGASNGNGGGYNGVTGTIGSNVAWNGFGGAAVAGYANSNSSNTQVGVYGNANGFDANSAAVLAEYSGANSNAAALRAQTGTNGYAVNATSQDNNVPTIRARNTGNNSTAVTANATNTGVLVGNEVRPFTGVSVGATNIGADVNVSGGAGTSGVRVSDAGGTGVMVTSSATGANITATGTGVSVANGAATGVAIGTTGTAGMTVAATAGTTNVTINGAATNAVNVTGTAPTGILVNSTGTTGVSVSNNTTGVNVSGGTTGVNATGQTGSSFNGQNSSASATGALQNSGAGSALSAQNNSASSPTAAITNSSATGSNALTAQNTSATSATATFTNTLASGAGAIQANNTGTLATISANNAYSGGGVSLGGVARFTNSNNNGKSHSTLTLGNSIAGPANNNYALVVTDGIVDFSSTNTVVLAPNLAAQVTIVNPPSGSPSNSLLVTATSPTGVNVTGATGTGFATTGAVTGANISGTTTGLNANVTGSATAIIASAATGSAINATNNSSSNATLSVTNSAAGQTAITVSGNVTIPVNGSIQVLSNAASTYGTTATDATKLNVVGILTLPGPLGVPIAQSELFVNGDANIAGTVTANNVYVLGTLVLPPGSISTFDSVNINKAGVRRLTVGIAGTASTTEFNVMAGATTNLFGPVNIGTLLVPSTTNVFGPTTINGGTSTSGTQIGNANSTTTVTGPTNMNITGTSTTTIGSATNPTNINGPVAINGGTSASTTSIGNALSTTNVTGPTNINTTGSAATTIGSTGTGGAVTINAASSNTITANGNTVVNGAASGAAALTVNPATNKSGVIVNGNGTQPAVAINSTGSGRAIEVQSNNNVFLGGTSFGAPNVINTTFMHDVQIDGNLLLTGTASLAVSTTASPALSGKSIQHLGIGVRGVTHPTATNVPGAGVLGIALDPTPADGSPESSSDPTTGVPNPTVNAGVNGYVENDKYFGGVFQNSNKLNTNLLNDQATALEALAHDNGVIGTTGRGILVTQPNNPDQLWTGVEVANTNNSASRIRRAIFVNSNGGTIDTGIVVDPVIYGIDVQAGTTAVTDDYGLRIRPTVFTVGGQTLNEGVIVEGTNGAGAQITRGITVNADATGAMTHGMRIGTAPSQTSWNGTNALGATSNAPVVGIDARFRGGNSFSADPAGSTTAPFGMRVNTVNNGGAGFVGGDAVANTLNEGAVLEATNVGVRVGTQYNTAGGSAGGVTPTTGENITIANNGTGSTTTTLAGGNTITMGYQAINVNGNITNGMNVQTTGTGNIHIGYQASSNTTIDTAAELVSNGAMAKGVNIRSLTSTIGTGVNVQTSSTNAITGAGVNIQSNEANINQGVVIQATGSTLGTVGNGVTVFAGKTTAGTAITNGVLVNNATGSTITNGVQVGNNTAVSGAIGNGLWVNNGSSPGAPVNVITNGALIQTSGNNAGILTGFSTTTGGTNSNIGTGVNVSTTTTSATISTIGTGINVTTASNPAAGTNTIGTGVNVQNTGTLARIGTGINVQTNTGAISTGIAVTNAATLAAEAIGTGISVTNTGAPGGATQLINTGVNVSTSGANSAIGTGINVSTAGSAAAINNGVTVSASGGLVNAATFTTTGGNITNGVYVFPVANGNITNNAFEALTSGTGTIGTGLLVQSQNANVTMGVNVTTNGTGTVATGVNVGNVDNAGTGVVVNAKNANNGVGVNIGNTTKMNTGVRGIVQSGNAAAASYGAATNGGVVMDNTTPVGTAVNQSIGVLGAMTGGTSTFAQMTTISAPLSFTDFSAGVAGDGSAAATNERPGVIAVTSSPLSATNNNSNNRGALEAYNTNGGIAVAGYSSGIPFLGVTTGAYVLATGVEGRSSNTTQGVGMVGGTHTPGNVAGNAGTGVLGWGQLTGADLAGTAINVDIINGMVAGVIGSNGPNAAGTRIGVMGTDLSGTTPAILSANASTPRIGVYGVTGGTGVLDAGVVAEAPANGTGVLISQVTSGIGVNANSITNGTGVSVAGVTTGTGVNLGTVITTGNGVSGTLVAAASGKLINLTDQSTTAGGHAIAVSNTGTQDAVNITNTSTGRGVAVANQDGGKGVYVNNSNTGLGLHIEQTANSPTWIAKIENSGTGTATDGLKIDNSSTGAITNGIDIDPVTNGIISSSTVSGATFTVVGATAVPTSGVNSLVSNTNAGGALTGASFATTTIATQTGTGLQVTATGAGTNNGIVVNTGAGNDLVINEDGAKRTGSGTFTFGNTATTTDATNVVIATGTAASTTSTLTLGSDAAGAATTNPGALVLWDPTETAGVQNKGTVNTLDLTADRTWSFPDVSGTIGIIPAPIAVDFVWYGTNTQQAEAGLTDPTRRLFDVAYNAGVLAGNAAGAIVTSTANSTGNNAATGLTVSAKGNANGNSLGATIAASNTNAGTGTITGATVSSSANGANSGAQLGLGVSTTTSATSTGTIGGMTVGATGGLASGAVSGLAVTTASSNANGSTGLTLSTTGTAGGNATGISNTLTSGAQNNMGQFVKVSGALTSNIGEDIQASGTGSLGIRIEGTGAGGSAPYPANGIIVTGPTSTGVSVNTIDLGANGFTVDWVANANAKVGAGLAVNLGAATGASSATGVSVSNVGNNTGIAIGMTVAGSGVGMNVTNVDVQTGIQVLSVAGGGKGIVSNVTAGASGTAARFNGGNSSSGTALEIAGGAVRNTAAGTVADPRFADTYTTTVADALGGAATINNPLVTATSTIVVTVEGPTIDRPRVTARVAGTSFTVNFLAPAAGGGDKIHYIIIQHP